MIENDILKNDIQWNNCSNDAKSFILCMNTPKIPKIVSNDKCKNLFDTWFKCISSDLKIK